MTVDENLLQLELPSLLSKLKELIRTPYGDPNLENIRIEKNRKTLETLHAEVTEMVGLLQSDGAIPLSSLSDIRPLLERLKPEESYLEASEINEVKSNLFIFDELSRYIKSARESSPNLVKYAERIHPHPKILKEIESTIDSRGEIIENASPALRKIRIDIHRLESEQKTILLRVLKRYSEFSQDDIVTMRDGRLVLGIQQQYISRINGIVHGTSGTGATAFVEPMETLRVSNQIQNLKLEERREIIRILKFLSGLIREVRDDIYFSLENFGGLDFIHAKARLAVILKAAPPVLSDRKELRLLNARHPLLLLKMNRQEVVPSNLTLGENFNTLIITGPNAGGKTVSLKMIGLLSVMSQLGMHIPAHPDSILPIFDHILVDIGDRQNLEQDLSTFSAHVVRLQEILAQATEDSLVLLDEVGTGTDPREGSSLAIAYLKELVRRKCLTVATTHHGELKAFAFNTTGVENASMEFNLETLLPSYRLQVGIPGSSYAFEIARRYGLSEVVLTEAMQILGAEKNQLENLIISLNDRLQRAEKERREINIKLTESEGLKNLYQKELDKIQGEKKEVRRKAAEEAKRIVEEANQRIEKLVADIRKSQASRENIKQAHQSINELKKVAEKILEETAPQQEIKEIFQKGDIVWIETLREEAEILTEPDGEQKAWVLVRDMRMNLSVSDFKKLYKRELSSNRVFKNERSVVDGLEAGIFPEIDLRGMDSFEAINATDRYLDQAINNGWQEICIIHGKGSGILRREINKFLSKDKRVEEKRLGKWGEGDTGVTIVKLKYH
ncbi:MAG: endonuclease MutS2 [bacterium]|nr:MAG: endonuclease MutS2 [bacterium]